MMSEYTDPDLAWPKILDALASRDVELLKTLLWPRRAGEDWYYSMAPMIENAGGGYEKSDTALALFCYEQARDLYIAQASGATSGGEGLAMMNEGRDRELGRKIWLLKSEGG
jgi:hypothetical protein